MYDILNNKEKLKLYVKRIFKIKLVEATGQIMIAL